MVKKFNNLIFFHISFIFIKVNKSEKKNDYKVFHQKLFDTVFNQIEINMRELGFSDTTINKNMKSLTKDFYNILLNCEDYEEKKNNDKEY